MKKLLYLVIGIAIIISGCQKKQDTIKIGVAGPISGSLAKMGADFKNGVELAVKLQNEKGGLLAKQIEMVIGDDQADPKQAVSVANKLINSGVIGVIGHFTSSSSIPASEYYNTAGIPMITPASTNPQLTERGFKGVFRVCGRDDQQGAVAAKFAKQQLKIKKAAIVHDKTTYGQGLAGEFQKSMGAGTEIVYFGGIAQGEKDFKSVLTSIKSKNPDLIYFGGIYPEGGLMVKQAREIGIKAPFLSGDALRDDVFLQIAGKASEGTYVTFSASLEGIPTAREFIEQYKKTYGEPGLYSIYAFDAANIMFASIMAAGSTDGSAISEKIHSGSFRGALGEIKFDAKGDVTAPAYIVWVANEGKFVEHWKP